MYLSRLDSMDSEEIASILNKASLFGGVIVQQGSLLVNTCPIYRIEVHGHKVVLRILGKHQLEGAHVLCINLAYRNFTFSVQGDQFTLFEDKIVCDMPLKAKAIPVRPGGDRHVLPYDTLVPASLHRIEKRGEICSSQMNIVDISRQGIGAYLFEGPEEFLQKNDHAWIREINLERLEAPIFCKVCYVNKRRYKDNVMVLRIGLSTDKAIPEEVYSGLIGISRLVLSA